MKRLIVLLMLMASPAMALTQDTIPTIYHGESGGVTCRPSFKTIHCSLILFGSTYQLSLPEGSTINEAIESIANVKHGVVCCDNRDIQSINGLSQDPYHNAWWVIRVNGNSQNYSSHSRLSSGDVVELVYTGKVDHQKLESWLLSFSKGR